MVDAPHWASVYRLLVKALPVSSLDSTLEAVSTAWRQITSAQAAIAWVRSEDSTSAKGVLCSEDRPSEGVELQFSDPARADTTNIGAEVFQRLLSQRDQSPSITSIPLYLDRRLVATIELLDRGAESGDSNFLAEFTGICARLIANSLGPGQPSAASTDRFVPDEDKLQSLAEFAAGAGHEINNPVATIAGRAALLLRDESDPERRRALTTIGGQAYRIRDMIGDLMLFGRPPAPSPEQLNLNEAISEVTDNLRPDAELKGCRIEFHPHETVPVWADKTQLSVVISSLIRNSIDASQEGGVIEISSRNCKREERNFASFSVVDNGIGLSETDQQHLFDPFYSGRQAGRGLGFGLCKCWRIVSNHDGVIEFASRPDEETRFDIYFPAEPVDLPCLDNRHADRVETDRDETK